MNSMNQTTRTLVPFSHALRRVGFAGLLFFTVKGLLWLALPLLLAQQL